MVTAAAHDRLELLDALRALALLAVMLFHFAFRGAAADGFTNVSWPELIPVAKYGYLGVQLFFVISGFVIAYSADGQTATRFAIARVARIYPAFILCMTITFLVTMLFGAPRLQATAQQWLANLIIVAPALKQPFVDGAYWSLVYEVTFYGWVFLLLAFGLFRRDGDWVVIAWLAISIINETFVHSGLLRRLFLTDQSAFFCAGLILYEFYRGRRDRKAWLLLMLATLTAISQAFVDAAKTQASFHAALDPVVIAAVTVGVIGLVACATRWPRLPLPKGWLVAIGGLTYPLYLLHQHIGYMLMNAVERLASAPTVISAVAAAMTLTTWAIWRYADRPAQRWLSAILTQVFIRSPRQEAGSASRGITSDILVQANKQLR